MNVNTSQKRSLRTVEKSQPEGGDSVNRVVGIIVHKFKGDTRAFFESVTPAQPSNALVEKDASLARKYVKCVA